jgi:hypothetical protein
MIHLELVVWSAIEVFSQIVLDLSAVRHGGVGVGSHQDKQEDDQADHGGEHSTPP